VTKTEQDADLGQPIVRPEGGSPLDVIDHDAWDLPVRVLLRRVGELETQGLVTATFRDLDPEQQQSLLRAVLAEAADHGPTELDIERVATRADVAVDALRAYFGDREGLLRFVVALSVGAFEDTLAASAGYLEGMPLRDAIDALLAGTLAWCEAQPGLAAFVARATYQSDETLREQVVAPMGRAMLALLRAVLEQASERGELDQTIDLEATARLLNANIVIIVNSVLLPQVAANTQLIGSGVNADRIREALLTLVAPTRA
jgi:AcrR family transcriptional regulator